MATWDQLKGYVHSNYKATDISPRAMEMLFETTPGRSQVAYVTLGEGFHDDVWAQIDSPVGKIGEVDLISALSLAENVVCGGLVHLKLQGQELVSLRHCVPLENLDPNEFELPLRAIISAADALEQELTGQDVL